MAAGPPQAGGVAAACLRPVGSGQQQAATRQDMA